MKLEHRRSAHPRAPASARSLGHGARVATVALLVLSLASVEPAPSALADGDPASDVLLAQSAFYPYNLPEDRALEASMNDLLKAAAHAGLPLKVAVIGSRLDLGAVPNLYGHPQQYAEYLDREISFNQKQPLLVVMPQGFGLASVGPADALNRTSIDTRQGPYGLVLSAMRAVVALVRATGHSISLPKQSGRAPRAGGPPAIVLFAVPIALLVLGGAVLTRRRRRGES